MDMSRRSALLAAAAAAGLSSNASAATQPLARLDLNENAYGPSPSIEPAVRAALRDVHRYIGEEAKAFEALVAAIEGVQPDQVVVGEVLAPLGLQIALSAGRGSRFVHSSPGYPGFTDAAAAVGGLTVPVPLNSRLENDLPALLEETRGATALFVVNPHNPSGTVSERVAFHAFLREAQARTLVVVDEAYLEYTDDFAGRTAAPLVGEGLNIVVFRTLAKVYGLAGMQIGYALAPPSLARSLKARGVGAPRSLDRLALAAGSAALADQAHVARVREAVASERTMWHAALDAKGWAHSRSSANFVFFDAGRPQTEVAALLRAHRIEVGRPHPPLVGWTRVTVGSPAENARVRGLLGL
jgi:histidinol-phosphate aminotransferase